MVVIKKEQIEKYVGKRIFLELSVGKSVFGFAKKIDDNFLELEFLNRHSTLKILISTIISIQELTDEEIEENFYWAVDKKKSEHETKFDKVFNRGGKPNEKKL